MKRLETQKGFTLVELAIVMTIIGLLIGGILKGQELMANARVTSTVAQVKAYEAALTSFRDMYQAYPGDLTDGSTRVTGCTAACDVTAATASADGGGDNIVGSKTWNTSWAAQATTTTAGGPETEPYLFWQEMMLANLTGGVTRDGLDKSGTTYAWGVTHPAAKIAGGFVAGYDDGTQARPGWTSLPGVAGTFIVLTTSPIADLSNTAGAQPLPALRAAQIDRKMDDGKPDTGDVTSYGTTDGCQTDGAGAAPSTYDETVSATDCGLFFHIDG